MLHKFKDQLIEGLPSSTSAQRSAWAKQIVDNQLDLKALSDCLEMDYKIASRFAWLLSGVGMYDPSFLKKSLEFLFNKMNDITTFNFSYSIVKYWAIAGIPEANEGAALDLLFDLFNAPKTDVHIKAKALEVLFELYKKYPEIKNELVSSIESEQDKNTNAFQKKAGKILKLLYSADHS